MKTITALRTSLVLSVALGSMGCVSAQSPGPRDASSAQAMVPAPADVGSALAPGYDPLADDDERSHSEQQHSEPRSNAGAPAHTHTTPSVDGPHAAAPAHAPHGPEHEPAKQMDHSGHTHHDHGAADHSQHGAHTSSPKPDKDVAPTAAPTADDETVIYVCPMHPEVTDTKPSRCPKCGMKLEPSKSSGQK